MEIVPMIELTDFQIQAINEGQTPPLAVNPKTRETYVLLPLEEYQRLAGEAYDDAPWTREELHAQAWEAGRSIGWEEMDEYDDLSSPS